CNAARRRKLSGIETWTLNVASNRYAARLATFENADTDRSASDLRLILADLATRANADDSRDIAQSVQSALVRAMRSRGEKVPDPEKDPKPRTPERKDPKPAEPIRKDPPPGEPERRDPGRNQPAGDPSPPPDGNPPPQAAG